MKRLIRPLLFLAGAALCTGATMVIRGPVVAGPSFLTNLISYWKMDEASGTRADSVVTTANDLTDNNTVGSNTGIISNAGDFVAASSEYLSRANNSSLQTGDIDFTFRAWVYLSSTAATNYQSLINKASGSNIEYQFFFNGQFSSPQRRFEWKVSADGTSTVSVLANNFGTPTAATWYCVHVWHDSVNNEIGISVNAGTADTLSHSGGVRAGTANFEIGRNVDDGTGGKLTGRVDEVAFWKRVLTPAERTSDYNAGAGRTHPF